ncbi:MAG: F0F1 ATP synthase subunit A [Bacillota bacterium]|jgi:F-type H+-transporting ATPase subunit a
MSSLEAVLEGARTVFTLFGLPITESVVNTWLVMAVLIILALVLRRNFQLYPDKRQNVAEIVVEALSGLVASTMGPKNKGFMPYIATVFFLLFFSNVLGVFGLRPPTADFSVTIAYGIVTFFCIHYYALKAKGWSYLKGMAEPFIFLLPMNIIGEVAKPFSLGMRLYGNLLGGSVIMAMISGAIALFVPAVASIYFDLFSAVLQSFIFIMLTMVFIAIAKDDEE